MIPLSDDNPTLRRPVVTMAIIVTTLAVWILVQGAGLDPYALVSSVCNYGLVPGEITGRAPLGEAVPITKTLACVVDADPRNVVTPLTSMFLHSGWAHILGNLWFLWIFGNNVEDSMGRIRFAVFYVLCGLAAAAVQIAVQPASPVPMVGASGAISGVLGAYLVLYPRVRVNVLVPLGFFWPILPVPAYLMLVWWIALQIVSGLPQLLAVHSEVATGVAFFAHIGGFFAGVLLVKLFEDRRRVARRNEIRHRLHPRHP